MWFAARLVEKSLSALAPRPIGKIDRGRGFLPGYATIVESDS
jgi:hypothetical protein